MINIICSGKIKEKYLNELIDDYLNRIGKYHKISIIEIKDSNDLEEESNRILKYLKSEHYSILLDIHGDKIDSLSLSDKINKVFIEGHGTIDFIIGGSNGASNKIKDKVNSIISFGDITYPHGLFRGILLEQIYRSFKIINNEEYHK